MLQKIMFSTFYNKISVIIDKHIPVKQRSEKECKFLSKPCITTGLRKSIISRTNSINQNLFTPMPNLSNREIS